MLSPTQQSQAGQMAAPPAAAPLIPPAKATDLPAQVSSETPGKTTAQTTAQKVEGVGKILAGDVRKGIDYANARRARDTYKPVQL